MAPIVDRGYSTPEDEMLTRFQKAGFTKLRSSGDSDEWKKNDTDVYMTFTQRSGNLLAVRQLVTVHD